MLRVITYIDGFNLYFGLKSKGWKKYYWLDLASMSKALLKQEQKLVACHYFTARIKGSRSSTQSAKKQTVWLEALETRNDIRLHFGHYLQKEVRCRNCGTIWQSNEEKMTDVNIATQLLIDAFNDDFDVAIVISGDSDLTTPIQNVKKLFSTKKVIVAFPPDRHSIQLKQVASGYISIGEDKLRNNLLPNTIEKQDGHTLTRPSEWY